jgi:hypothetical protein
MSALMLVPAAVSAVVVTGGPHRVRRRTVTAAATSAPIAHHAPVTLRPVTLQPPRVAGSSA